MFNENLCTACGLCMKKCPEGVHSFVGLEHKVDFQKCLASGECIKVCMPEALSLHGREATVEEILGQMLKDMDYYRVSGGGVTISGGEPLRQPEFVISLAKRCHDQGVSVYLDTCGFASEAVFAEVADVVDGLLYDIKLIDPEKHRYWTGKDNALILRNFKTAVSTGRAVRVRIVLMEGLTDTEEYLTGLVKLLKNVGFSGQVDIMPYHRMGAGKYKNMGKQYEMEDMNPPSIEAVNRVKAHLSEAGLTAVVQ